VFLKSLTIKGFKSFADATTLEFEPGVTVVVGPNGSGKSNVVDAVAWVLGAQGARTIRSSKMEDVIFAGSPKRAALGRAEVSLTIDNSAGLLPIEFSEVTISRTLFRGGESEYAINRVPCRLLDVQELLSDSGIGRQQHVIVSQGNLDTVLNARPEERRMVIEEAAGILKFRRRRERAERRLESTEASLVRLQDLQRELRRQLRPLEKQADAARRYESIVSELTDLRRYLVGRELRQADQRLEEQRENKRRLQDELVRTRQSLDEAESALSAAELEMDEPLDRPEIRLADLDARAGALQGKAAGLAAVLSERRRSLERELAYTGDADIIADLEAESAALSKRLDEAEREALELIPAADELAKAEQLLEEQRRIVEADEGDADNSAADPAAEVRGELAALKVAVQRSRAELASASARAASITERLARLEADKARSTETLSEAVSLSEYLRARETETAAFEEACEVERARSEERWRSASAEVSRWAAREEALAQALDEARAKAGVARLAGSCGVVGTLLELVDVDDGFATSFEAAAGEILAAVVVDSVDSARDGLAELRRLSVPGAVVALGAARHQGAEIVQSSQLPPGCARLREHVRGTHSDVDALLDAVLARSVVVTGGWQPALDLALERSDLTVVTADGDRFSGGLWRAGASGSGATGAALEEARAKSAIAVSEAVAAKADFEQAGQQLVSARREREDVSRKASANASASRSAQDTLARLEVELSERSRELEDIASRQSELSQNLARDEKRIHDLGAVLPALEAKAVREAKLREEAAERRRDLATKAASIARSRRELEVRAAGLDERRKLTLRRLAEVEAALARQSAERQALARRRERAEASIGVVGALEGLLADRLRRVSDVARSVNAARRAQDEERRARLRRLESLRSERALLSEKLATTLQAVNSLEVAEAETRTRMEALADSARRDLGVEPVDLSELDLPAMPDGVTPGHRRDQLERELRDIGPVNPLALEEHTALVERRLFVESQLDDVRSARRELAKVIQAIDAEITGVFAEAYADVAVNFEKLFARLFPGGEGRLELTDPQNLLETGIEVAARPSGKNLRRLSLLSGGERSLVAMAFLFAVFRSRPSPFYMMDEVEAALDDVNLRRFLDLIEEFRSEAQLLVVSHQKRTMEAADCLYGVTMAPGGASRVVSEKMADRQQAPAEPS
jgi:chromosome segregation protein